LEQADAVTTEMIRASVIHKRYTNRRDWRNETMPRHELRVTVQDWKGLVHSEMPVNPSERQEEYAETFLQRPPASRALVALRADTAPLIHQGCDEPLDKRAAFYGDY
jgi:hypothetical protein